MPDAADTEPDFGQVLFATVRHYRRLTDELLADLPGGPRGYQVLMTVQAEPPESQLALARYLGLDRTVMTYLLDALEGAGYVARRADPADRRARRIELTPAGAAALRRSRARLQTAEAELLSRLTAEEREQLRTLMHRVAIDPDTA
jgi:DNA-binding MarR family transcriptional regulator